MKPVNQTNLSKENGNCLQAAVASLLELRLEQVPHFIEYGEDWWFVFVDFFDSMGMRVFWTPDHQPLGTWHIASVKSKRFPEESHAVVCDPSGNIAHDPHPDSGVDPDEIEYVGFYWFLVKDPSDIYDRMGR